MKKNLLTILSIAALICIDQFTKHLAVINLKGNPPKVIWKGVFELLYSENTGAAFGMLPDATWFFIVITLIILVFVAFFYARIAGDDKFRLLRILLIFIASGAIGNFIDRFLNGYVVDFFYIRLIDFPVFNVADCYITWAGVMLALLLLFKYKDEDFKS